MSFYHFKLKFRDLKFIFKLSAFLLIMLFAIQSIILSIFIEYWYVNPTNKDIIYPYAFLQNIEITLTFWTTQTSLMVGIWFLFSLIYHHRENKNKFTNFTTQTTLTIYITITALIFWFAIFLNKIFTVNIGMGWFWNLSTKAIIISFFDHLIAPTFMIVYWFLSCGKTKIPLVKQLVYVWIYPLIYLSLVYIRAVILNHYNVKNFVYPYDILNLSKPLFNIPIIYNIFLVFIVIIITITSTTSVYWWINNKSYVINSQSLIVKSKKIISHYLDNFTNKSDNKNSSY